MPRGKNCRETIFAAQLPRNYPHGGAILKEEKLLSQRQSITQKGVHARALTAREREHWFLQHLSHFIAVNFGRQ